MSLYVRAIQTRLHFHFSYFRPVFASHTHIDRETDARTPTLLCRFYNLSLMCVYACVSVRARHVLYVRCDVAKFLTHTDANALTHTHAAYTASKCRIELFVVFVQLESFICLHSTHMCRITKVQ